MPIEQVEMFKYRGTVFPTEEKAQEYAEALLVERIKQKCIDKGLSVREWFKLCEVLIEDRKAVRELLDF